MAWFWRRSETAAPSSSTDLKDFIRQSLVEITEGLSEANTAIRQAGGTDLNTFLLAPGEGKRDDGVNFDVAVTTRATRDVRGKASVGIKVLGLEAGAGGQRARESVSRIRFTVMVRGYVGGGRTEQGRTS
jgi:hypothetical protein